MPQSNQWPHKLLAVAVSSCFAGVTQANPSGGSVAAGSASFASSASGVSARAAYESAMARLDAVVDALESPLDHTTAMAVDPLVKAGEAKSNTTEDEYKAMVARAKD